MQLFNNRELAIIIWLTVGVIWLIYKSDVRDSFSSLIKQLFHHKILTPYLLAVIYTLLGVRLLQICGLWTSVELKDTLLWCIITVFTTMMSLTKLKEDKNYFRDAAGRNFKFAVILEFVTGVYTFNLIIEIILVLIIILIGAMQAFAEHDVKFAQVNKILRNTVIVIGLFIIGHTIYEIILHFKEFASLDTFRDFILSPALAIWFLPFIYAMSLYMTYEEYYVTMHINLKNKRLLKFAKWYSFIKFNIDTKSFNRWRKRLFLSNINSKKDIIKSIKELRRLQLIEKNPPPVDPKLGWSPYQAKDFLASHGLDTDYYAHYYENEWSTSSKYLNLGKDFLSNAISYSVIGEEKVAKTLELYLNINVPSTKLDDTLTFLNCVRDLYSRALNRTLPSKLETAIIHGKSTLMAENGVKIYMRKDDWAKNQGRYSLRFTIEHE